MVQKECHFITSEQKRDTRANILTKIPSSGRRRRGWGKGKLKESEKQEPEGSKIVASRGAFTNLESKKRRKRMNCETTSARREEKNKDVVPSCSSSRSSVHQFRGER